MALTVGLVYWAILGRAGAKSSPGASAERFDSACLHEADAENQWQYAMGP